ncbi:hypothetical protein V6N12_049654 [Hibiscus sabdariffa]|uniref:Uncharacterized protein n=1 Tax=Hibiscus sabdariffa TaxID=183260 RepID=A0ABR2GA70_9ROSI
MSCIHELGIPRIVAITTFTENVTGIQGSFADEAIGTRNPMLLRGNYSTSIQRSKPYHMQLLIHSGSWRMESSINTSRCECHSRA